MADGSTILQVILEGVDTASAAVSSVESSLKSLGEVVAGGLMFEKLKEGVTEVLNAFEADQTAATQLKTTLADTGNITGVTGAQTEALAQKIMGVSTYTNQAIISAENMIAKFTNISSSVFPQAMTAATDLAAAYGTDLTSAATIVGRALQEPEKAARSLRAANIILSADQIKLIKNLTDTGNAAGAQQYILGLLSTMTGGQAAAATTTLAGKMAQFSAETDLVNAKIGGLLAGAITPFLSKALDWVQSNQSMVVSMAVAGGAVLAL